MKSGTAGRTTETPKTGRPPRPRPGSADASVALGRLLRRLRDEEKRLTDAVEDMKTRRH